MLGGGTFSGMTMSSISPSSKMGQVSTPAKDVWRLPSDNMHG